MSDRECAALLAWAAQRLGLADAGFARVRGQVRKRVSRRIGELRLPDAAAYRAFLERDASEWTVLDRLCRVTISRFWRDGPAFDALTEQVLPALVERARARDDLRLRIWSLACASGEEPYSVALAWHLRLAPRCPGMSLDLVASDVSPHLLERAARAEYPASIFRELPADLRAPLAIPAVPSELVHIPAALRAGVTLRELDVRRACPPGPFDLILCRNLVFTYFDDALRARLLAGFHARTVPGGALMIGKRECLPDSRCGYESLSSGIYVKSMI